MHHNLVLTIFHTQNVDNYQNCIAMWGEGHEIEKNCRTNLSHIFPCFSNLLPGIREQWNIKVRFWEFATHDDVYFVRGKLSELHLDTDLSPNWGENVLGYEKISWTQNLRVQLMCSSEHLYSTKISTIMKGSHNFNSFWNYFRKQYTIWQSKFVFSLELVVLIIGHHNYCLW